MSRSIRHQWNKPGLLTLIALVLTISIVTPMAATSAPSPGSSQQTQSFQTPEWMSLETSARLGIGINVLAPPYVPAPFGGEPQVQAYEGFYSLYWMVPGAPPTFLRITGEYGGFIPDFSYFDRNIQLSQNAEVQGYPAFHDVSPIYDVVYWRVGDVVYTVESHNLVSDSTMGIANMLQLVDPPAPPAQQETGANRSFTLGVPTTVWSGETVGVGVFGDGEVLLTAQDGYFPATGSNTVVVQGGTTINWVAPSYEADATLYFYVYDLDSGSELASGSVYLEGYASSGEDIFADVQCPSEATAGKQARLAVVGNGTLTLTATRGIFPAESPNTAFQPDASGENWLRGTLPDGATMTLSWVAPQTPETAHVSVFDVSDNLLDECAISVVTNSVSGDLGAPVAQGAGGIRGDGTGVVDVDPAIVLRVIANPSGFAGDASGGPEANGPDYGLVSTDDSGTQLAAAMAGASTAVPESDASSVEEVADTDFGPSTGADGMVAQAMGASGGTLANPLGATVIVPSGAFADQTSVMIKPAGDHELPAVAHVDLVPGTAFDVSFSQTDGRSVEQLNKPAILTLSLKSALSGQGARIYQIDGSTIRPMPLIAEDAGSLSTEVTAFSRYVVGVPAPTVAGTTRPFNPILVGLLAMIALLSAGLLISRGLQRRRTRIIPVRRPAPNRVRYR